MRRLIADGVIVDKTNWKPVRGTSPLPLFSLLCTRLSFSIHARWLCVQRKEWLRAQLLGTEDQLSTFEARWQVRSPPSRLTLALTLFFFTARARSPSPLAQPAARQPQALRLID